MSSSTTSPSAAQDPKVFSMLGLNLKANTAEELEPHLSVLKDMDEVEVVRLGGNSLGVEACRAIAQVLGGKTKLKVGLLDWTRRAIGDAIIICTLTFPGGRPRGYLYWPLDL
jgi:hypothetical protein